MKDEINEERRKQIIEGFESVILSLEVMIIVAVFPVLIYLIDLFNPQFARITGVLIIIFIILKGVLFGLKNTKSKKGKRKGQK